jgi:hypothetical protein
LRVPTSQAHDFFPSFSLLFVIQRRRE